MGSILDEISDDHDKYYEYCKYFHVTPKHDWYAHFHELKDKYWSLSERKKRAYNSGAHPNDLI